MRMQNNNIKKFCVHTNLKKKRPLKINVLLEYEKCTVAENITINECIECN